MTFDGNGHKIIAPNAATVISLTGRAGVTVKNVEVAGDPAARTGVGFLILNSLNTDVVVITVKSAEDAIDDLIAMVNSLDLKNRGIKSSFGKQ